ncbi:hypothetical protein, partial [Streptococcus pneumoniae]|uniref:hypothetical protein n=1 Tax=Streptococcus pneumoniae TaxID=1313 RepID=UPI001CECDC61
MTLTIHVYYKGDGDCAIKFVREIQWVFFTRQKRVSPLWYKCRKKHKRKETHMNSLPNHHFQNKSFYQLSFDGGH